MTRPPRTRRREGPGSLVGEADGIADEIQPLGAPLRRGGAGLMAVLIALLSMTIGRRAIPGVAIAGLVRGGGSLSSVVHALLLWGGGRGWGKKRRAPSWRGPFCDPVLACAYSGARRVRNLEAPLPIRSRPRSTRTTTSRLVMRPVAYVTIVRGVKHGTATARVRRFDGRRADGVAFRPGPPLRPAVAPVM
jgi:hypothetical protein